MFIKISLKFVQFSKFHYYVYIHICFVRNRTDLSYLFSINLEPENSCKKFVKVHISNLFYEQLYYTYDRETFLRANTLLHHVHTYIFFIRISFSISSYNTYLSVRNYLDCIIHALYAILLYYITISAPCRYASF